jgi:hypothetical protein
MLGAKDEAHNTGGGFAPQSGRDGPRAAIGIGSIARRIPETLLATADEVIQ